MTKTFGPAEQIGSGNYALTTPSSGAAVGKTLQISSGSGDNWNLSLVDPGAASVTEAAVVAALSWVAKNQITRPLGVGGAPLSDTYNRMVATLWGPTNNVAGVGYGFSALSMRCDNDGTDKNTNSGVFVKHASDYSATAGYADTVQLYGATGTRGLVLGCNTEGGYLRYELGPLWPDSEVGRIIDRGTGIADWIHNWVGVRTITASQSATTVTLTSGTVTTADIGRWICWNTYGSNKTEGEAFRIVSITDSTHCVVDTSRTVPSQTARINTANTTIYSNGSLETKLLGVGGPVVDNNGRFPATFYSTTSSSFNFCALTLATDTALTTALTAYQYDPVYTYDVGLAGCAQLITQSGSQGLLIGTYSETGDIRLGIGYTAGTLDSEMLRIIKRGANSSTLIHGMTTNRSITVSQGGTTTVTATSGTFSAADAGRYILRVGTQYVTAGSGELLKIVSYTDSTHVVVDRALNYAATTAKVVIPKFESDQGAVRAESLSLRSGTVGYVLTCSNVDGTLALTAAAGGGNAQTASPLSQFAATTSAQLAGVISDETGTGALVFANSPTLATPALGTPSALVGTNISGTAVSLTAGNVTTNANMTGDVTSSGSNATTIAAGAVSLAKMANVATATVFYRKTAATGVPEVQPLATLKTDLGLTGTNSGDQDLSTYALKTYVDNAVVGLLDDKGALDCSANPNYPAGLKGDAYHVTVAGKVGGASGVSVDIGDVVACQTDNAGGTQASVGTSWYVLEHNLVGALVASNNLSDLASASTARTNLGLGTLATQSGTFSGTSSGTNTGDNAINSLYSGLVSNATHTGDATGATALTVVALNGVNLAALTTGILKNTTTTGTPSIAVAADFPTLNQNTTGSAATLSATLAVNKGGTGLTALGTGLQVLRTNAGATAMEWATIAGGGDALVANPLSQFAATTSAQLAGVISDETGSGLLVFGTAPTLSNLTIDRLTLSGNISAAAWTTSGLRIKGVAATLTDTTSTGTVAAAYTDVFGGNTIAASAATTFTNYLTAFFKEGTAGTNVTLTNKWALGAESLRVGTSNQLTVGLTGVLTATSSALTTPTLTTPIIGAVTYTTLTGMTPSSYTGTVVEVSDRGYRLAISDGSFWRWSSTGAKIAETPAVTLQIKIPDTTTGAKKLYLKIPFALTITSWELVADVSGSLIVDIWKDSYANYPPTVADTITASAKPTLSSQQKNTSSTLTGWTTSLAAGDYLEINVDSVTTVTNATLTLTCDRA